MRLDIYVHLVSFESKDILHTILTGVTQIMASQQQLVADLNTVTAQVAKIGEETAKTLAKVTELEAALANAGSTTPEVDEALSALKAQAQLTDDMVPDVTP